MTNSVGVAVPSLIDQLEQSNRILDQAVSKIVEANKPITPIKLPKLADYGSLGTKINTYA